MKRINYKTSDYNKYLRVNESLDFANKEIDFGKKNTTPNQKLLGYNSI
jgi:hypothetical protein